MKHFLIGLSLLTFGLPAYSTTDLNLPEIGSSAEKVMPLTEEQRIGDQIMMQIQHHIQFVDDPILNEYINHLGFKLVAANPDARGRNFQFFIIKDPTLNAFALPGGYIGINTGLILAADTEDELAGVVAHEIAHITQRHFARRIEHNQQLTLPMIAGMIGAVLIASQNPEAGVGAMMTTQAGAQQLVINHTRANEHEADRIGIATLYNAGFNPIGIASFFEKIQSQRKFVSHIPEFLSTHPSSSRRIADARSRAYLMTSQPSEVKIDFELLKAEVQKVQYEDAVGKRIPQPKLDPIYRDSVLDYFDAIVQLEEKPDTAAKSLDTFAKSHPVNLLVQRSMARAYCKQEKFNQCFAIFDRLLDKFPGNDAIIREYGDTSLLAQKPQKAMTLYRQSLEKHPDDIFLLYNMAQAAKKANEQTTYHEYLGRYLHQIGDFHGAIAQFKVALKTTEDNLKSLRIQSRIAESQKSLLTRHFEGIKN